MDVKGIRNATINPSLDYVKKDETEVKPQPGSKGDKIELSDLAKKIQAGEVNSKDLSEIRQKIADNFYNRDAVIETVAKNILREISG